MAWGRLWGRFHLALQRDHLSCVRQLQVEAAHSCILAWYICSPNLAVNASFFPVSLTQRPPTAQCWYRAKNELLPPRNEYHCITRLSFLNIPPPLVSYAMQITFAHLRRELRRMTEGNNGNLNVAVAVAVRIRNALTAIEAREADG